jgi:hypothetical protein
VGGHVRRQSSAAADFTMTVAEAAAAGCSHVYGECCSLTALPFRLIRGLRSHNTLGQIAAKLRCQRCGKAPKKGTVAFWCFPTVRGRLRARVELNHHRALAFCLSMIFSESRFPLFRIML